MKRKLVLIIGCMSATLSYGQFFVEPGVGYGISLASDAIDYEATESGGMSGYTWNDKQVKGSFGAGLNFGLNLGYMINPNIGVGLSANMLMGKEFSGKDTYTGTGYSSSNEWSWKGKQTRLAPSIILSGSGDKYVPFARLGFVLGLGSTITYHSNYSNSDGDVEVITFELNESMAYGFSAELGLQCVFTDRISLIASVNSINMSWAPGHFEYTEYTSNGIDQLPSMTVYDREINFVESTSGNSSTPPNTGQPDEMLRIYFPFSSVGLNIGVRFTL